MKEKKNEQKEHDKNMHHRRAVLWSFCLRRHPIVPGHIIHLGICFIDGKLQ